MVNRKRFVENDRIRAVDRDFFFSITRKSDGLKVRHKTTDTLRAAMKAQNIAVFEQTLDRAIEQDNRRKHIVQKNAEEMEKIKKAAAKGIPIESRIMQPDPKAPPVKVVRIMPWWKRLRRWFKAKFGPTTAIGKVKPTPKQGG